VHRAGQFGQGLDVHPIYRSPALDPKGVFRNSFTARALGL